MIPKQLRIALDYDGTYTEDVNFWNNFIIMAEISHHQVTFVTYRTNNALDDNSDIESDALRCGIDIVYSYGQPKRRVFDADIWIDDSPELIGAPTLFKDD